MQKNLEKAFTLTEILISVVIVGVLSSVALPKFIGQIDRTCQNEAANNLNLLANKASTYKDIMGEPPTTWSDLNDISAVMTTTGPVDKDNGDLTTPIETPSCDYEIRRLSARSGEEFIFRAVPTPNNGKKAVFNVMSCFDLTTGTTDIKLGGKDVPSTAEINDLVCW